MLVLVPPLLFPFGVCLCRPLGRCPGPGRVLEISANAAGAPRTATGVMSRTLNCKDYAKPR